MTDRSAALDTSEIATLSRRLTSATIAGLVLTLAMPLHSRVVNDWIQNLLTRDSSSETPLTHAIGSQLIWNWAVLTLLVAIILRWERRPLASVGFKRIGKRDLLWVAGTWIVGAIVISLLPGRDFVSDEPQQTIFELPMGFKLALLITVAITEEVIHRTYIVERIAEITGRVWIGGAVTCAAFAAGHIPFFGLRTVLFVQLPLSVLFTVFYIRRRNLPASILLHLLVDLPILLPASVAAG
jgi:uncharacterized protein